MKNKKKKIIIIIVIVSVAIVLFELLCLIGYYFLNKYIETSQLEITCIEMSEKMESDEIFEAEYGEIVSITLDYDTKCETVEKSVIRIPCIVETKRDDQSYKYFVLVDYHLKNKVIVNYHSISKR